MIEVILQNAVGEELMINIEKGKIIGLYTFVDSEFALYDEKVDDLYSVVDTSWTHQGNKVFLHCPANKRHHIVKKLISDVDNGLLPVGEGDDADYREALWEMIKYYKWMNEPFVNKFMASE
jgi:hypothetical protein